jgi:F-type H+-transporting ATPase subunit delta
MSVTTIARRYADAVADVAIAKNQIEQVESELNAFAQMVKSNRELYEVFASPIIPNEQKKKVLAALVDRAKPSQTIANLLRVMLTNYRLHYIGEVYEQFKRVMNERRGQVSAEVTSAAPLTQTEKDLLSRKLTEVTGKKVELAYKTDPEIIGGIITRIGSVAYDGSIRTQLQTVKQKLKAGNR